MLFTYIEVDAVPRSTAALHLKCLAEVELGLRSMILKLW